MSDSEDIYDILKNKDIMSENDLKLRRDKRLKERKKRKLLAKAVILNNKSDEDLDLSDSESDSDPTMTERQTRLNYISSLIEPVSCLNHIFYLKINL